jgi:hypothetical protein
MEVDCNLLTLERRSVAEFVPVLAAPCLA